MTNKAYSSTHHWGSFIILLIGIVVGLSACTQLDIFEKNKPIPNNQWAYGFKPSFDFDILDTSRGYNVFIVLRHTDAYRYNNLWVNVGTQSPKNTIRYQKFELQLGSDAKGWEGTGMDDIWEVRKMITNGPVHFNKKGTYHFSIGKIMRENPLPNILSVGIRVEKIR